MPKNVSGKASPGFVTSEATARPAHLSKIKAFFLLHILDYLYSARLVGP